MTLTTDRESESEPISIRITFHLCRSDSELAIDSESVTQSESQTHSGSDSVTVTHSLVTVTRLV